ncbi:Ribonuclease HI (EC [Olavius algarvensis associated proteobacterium Delta 3]|nr:Ribonuclease HI (EC [Olavius algarvensis associated proteobacterium Delta 3]CAB5119892.1 Ribonuclease HI (EC [Olavius algarvensis associated proteobacterium Delta 3]
MANTEDDGVQWIRMRFKKNKVWLAADQNGSPVMDKGKVRIKYRVDQEYEYWVRPESVHPLDSPAGTEEDADAVAIEPPADPAAESAKAGSIEIYTDGASSGNPGPSGIGAVLRYGAHEREISRYIGEATNNIAELEAIRVALGAVKNRDLPVRLYTDSKYAHGVLTQGWKAKKNRRLIESIRDLMARFRDIRLMKIPGHAGLEGNERADRLAVRAIKSGG